MMLQRYNIFDDLLTNMFGESRTDVFGDRLTESSIEMDVPGCAREDIDLSLTDGLLTVKWKRRGQEYTRMFRVPRDIETENVTATAKDGVLTIQLPKKAKRTEQGRKITVS
jgi:HSP20 family protein